jgi:hypothetical protein
MEFSHLVTPMTQVTTATVLVLRGSLIPTFAFRLLCELYSAVICSLCLPIAKAESPSMAPCDLFLSGVHRCFIHSFPKC